MLAGIAEMFMWLPGPIRLAIMFPIALYTIIALIKLIKIFVDIFLQIKGVKI